MSNNRNKLLQFTALTTTIIMIGATGVPAHAGTIDQLTTSAQAADRLVSVNITSGTIADALKTLSKQAGFQLVGQAEHMAGEVRTPINGNFKAKEAVELLLEGTGIEYEWDKDTLIITGKLAPADLSAVRPDVEGNAAPVILEEVLVTASRRVQALQDVPMAITAVRPDDFTSVGLVELSDIAAYTPGFNFSNRLGRPGGGGTLTARGVGQQGGTPVVGVYMDDVPLSNNGPYANGEFAFDGLLGDIERVELLKGPQGTLYGATSIGGAVKYVTRKPALDSFRGTAKATLSSTNEGGFNKVFSGNLSTPIMQDKIGLTVAGFYEDNAGLVDRVDATTGTLNSENVDAYDRYGVSGDLYVVLSDRFDFRARFLHQEADYAGMSRASLDPNTLEPIHDTYDSLIEIGSNKLKNTYAAGTFEYRFDWATMTATSSYVEDNLATATDLTTLLSGPADFLSGSAPGTTTAVPFTEKTGSEKFVQEIRFTSEASDQLEWIAGLYYAKEDTTKLQTITAQPTGFNLFTSDGPSSYEEYAAFGNITYYFTPEFDITAGARISRSEMDVASDSSGPFGSGTPSISSIKSTVDTWMLAARYRPSETLSLYVRAASGYRSAPASVPLVDPLSGQTIQPLVAPDTLWSYEIGAKGDTSDGLFSYELALWYVDWSNFQAHVIFNGFNVFGNAESGITAKGLEGSFTYRPTDHFSIVSNFAYSDSSLNEDEPSLDGLEGQQVIFVPKWTFSTQARYDFEVFGARPAHIGGGTRYTGSSRSDFTDSGAFIPGVSDPLSDGPFDSAFNIPTDAFLLVDLNAGIIWDQVAINLFATNLFNKAAYGSTFGRNVDGVLEATGVPVKPRTIGISLSVDF